MRNAASTLSEAIESLVRQTWPHWELVLVDDQSDDDSRAVAEAWQCRDARVRLLRCEGRGIVDALRTGLRWARGEWIARLDADDIAAPERLARQWELLASYSQCGACATHVEDFGDVGEGRRRYSQWLNSLVSESDIERNLFVECPLAHPTLLMRRSALVAVGGYREAGWPEDYDLILRLWLSGWRLCVVPEKLLFWRDHAQRLSRRDPRYSPEAFRACKLHYLLQTPWLRSGRPLVQWGAGREGKWWLQTWPRECRPQAVVEVDPRKIGQRIHGVPVVSAEQLGPPQGRFLVVAVGVHGAREEIRPFLAARGWQELVDFVFVC